MAIAASSAACAPVTAHNSGGSLPELVHDSCTVQHQRHHQTITTTATLANEQNNKSSAETSNSTSVGIRTFGACGVLAEKLHGLTEKFHNRGHQRTDSDSSSRGRAGTCEFIFRVSRFYPYCLLLLDFQPLECTRVTAVLIRMCVY